MSEVGLKNNQEKFNSFLAHPLELIYPCDPCDYKATVKSNLKINVDSIHVEVIYPFDQCDYKATQKDDLKKHVESIHKGVCYPCNQ